jgi:hypothetical protein
MSPYEAGMTRGQHDAARVLNLEYYSDMMRCCGGDIPDVESLPLGVPGRKLWLLGYALGMITGTVEQET